MSSASEILDVVKNNSQNPSVFMGSYKELHLTDGMIYSVLYIWSCRMRKKLIWKSRDVVP